MRPSSKPHRLSRLPLAALPAIVLALSAPAAQASALLSGTAVTSTDGQIVPTTLAGTGAYTQVPDQFDVAHAADADLDRLGFPPRPDADRAPGAYRSWLAAVSNMRRVMPVLQPVAIHHGPMRVAAGPARMAPTSTAAATDSGVSAAIVASSANWSGLVTAAPAFSYGPQSFTHVYGDWVVPVAQPAFSACHKNTNNADVYSSTWVGIDGSGSGDVLQAGTESDATCTQGTIGAYQGAWYEWYPYNEVRVTNIPVTAGSAMYVYVWATSATRGHAYIADKSSHMAVSMAFDAPPGTKLVGNSAEWVVERPMVDGTLAQLTNYVQEFFAGAQASDASGNVYVPGAPPVAGQSTALQIQMTDDNNQVISVPSLIGQGAIWFTDQGSALSAKNG